MRISIGSTLAQIISVCATILVLSACQPPESRGFSLPEGNAEAGQMTFVEMGCISCHTVSGVTGLRGDLDVPERTIVLGGEKTRIYTYGELVTSVINPSHKISQTHLDEAVEQDGASLMRTQNDIMTVTELADLVTFLEQHYSLKEYEPTYYRPYGPM
ncbi:MAG: c-type cytochrome [Henriciella sp.]|nr:c-type cytochrome [Henriciella sp.]